MIREQSLIESFNSLSHSCVHGIIFLSLNLMTSENKLELNHSVHYGLLSLCWQPMIFGKLHICLWSVSVLQTDK